MSFLPEGASGGSVAGTTVGSTTSYIPSCGGIAAGPETIFTFLLPAGHAIEFWQSENTYDSRHETRFGGPFP
eukprot:COSAG06_NODE_66500_length_254_cov_0.670968_1_plen_71_part_10